MSSSDARFATIYRSYFKHVHAYCRRRTSVDRADDATAEVFLTAWRKIDQAPHGEAALPWLYGIAHGVVSNVWRGATRRHRLNGKLTAVEVDATVPPEEVVVLRYEARQILEALRRLKPGEQEILKLSLWEGLANTDLASVLGISDEAARQRLSRARRALAGEYDRLEKKSSVAQKGGMW